jgi:hypothetical protein
MSVRLSAVVLLAGLAFAAPVHAEVDLLNLEHLSDTQVSETAPLIAVDPSMIGTPVTALPSTPDQLAPVAEIQDEGLTDPLPEPATLVELAGPTPSEEKIQSVSLALESIVDHNQDEMLAWIATDLASAGEVTTGSVAPESAGTETLLMEQRVVYPLEDNTPSLEEQLIP